MMLEIDYTENIIVAIIHNGSFNWYVSDKVIWYLDYQKLISDYAEQGFIVDVNNIEECRKSSLVLDTNNAQVFTECITENKVTVTDLRESLIKHKNDYDDTWIFDHRASLYIDFDKKIFYSQYSEPASYEFYVPKNWYSEYRDFEDEIPDIYKYWINEDGNNLFEN